MAKQVQGSCNHCGHCGCYAGASQENEWAPGIPGFHFDWGRRHPVLQPILIQIIKDAFEDKFDRPWKRGDFDFKVDIRITGGGPLVKATCYVTKQGIQVSAADASCPFFQLGTPNECKLWGRQQLPPACSNTPQVFHLLPNGGEEMIAKWETNHPHTSQGGPCGYYWIDI